MARTGRPRLDKPRTQSIFIRVTEDEYMEIKAYAEKHSLTITQTLVDGFKVLKNKDNPDN